MNLEYFKKAELQPLFRSLRDKYIKTGQLIGIVSINIENEKELIEIEKFLRNGKILNIGVNKIKIKDIINSLNKSKYVGVDILDILKYLYGVIITKEEQKNELDVNNNKLLMELKAYFNNKIVDYFINNDSKTIINLLKKEKNLVYNVFKALINLPKQPILLNVFATNITNDPHYFDWDTKNFNLFLKFLVEYHQLTFPDSRDKKIELLNSFNLINDSYSNNVMIYNLRGEDYLDILANKNQVITLNVSNISSLKELYTLNKKVLIVENPSVLKYLVGKTKWGIIVTNGNPNLAFYEIMKKFNNHQFYYNGDFDPEGLLIADKLKSKYANLELIFYGLEHFNKCLSNKEISKQRLKKLNNIVNNDVNIIKSAILETKMVGYQESLITDLKEFID